MVKTEYKCPKVLEKRPVIAGFDLSTVVVVVIMSLLFVFALLKSVLISLLSLAIAIAFVKVQKKYPKKGQLKMVLKYWSNIQSVRMERPIRSLIQRE